MKKLLLGSTALLGAIALSGAASAQQVTTRAPFTVSIGGSISSYMGLNAGGDETLTANKKNYDFGTETLLQFSASAKTDNGLTYGGYMRRYFGNNANNQSTTADIDRVGVFVQGSFGRVEFGDVNSIVRSYIAVGVNAVGPAWGNGFGVDGGLPALYYNQAGTTISAGTGLGAYPLLGTQSSSRRTKITYTTPDFSGFQAGISYMPSPNSLGNEFDRTDTLAGSGASTAAPTGRAAYRDVVELSGRYTTKISGVDITPSFAYTTGATLKTPANGTPVEDASSLLVGLKLEYMGASLGVSYANGFKTGLAKGANLRQDETQGFVVALGYVTGPWAVSSYYQYGTAEGNQAVTASGDDSLRIFEIAAGYTLAPGLQLWTGVHNYELKDENVTKRNGTIFLLGTSLSF